MQTAWHYTTDDCARGILTDGIIRPATDNAPAGETPAVWFSINQWWEPTANKAIIKNGRRVALTMQQTVDLAGGAWRFGMRSDQLLPWPKLRTAMGMSPQMAQGLKRAGKGVGADPRQWYGHVGPIVLATTLIAVQVLRDGDWAAA